MSTPKEKGLVCKLTMHEAESSDRNIKKQDGQLRDLLAEAKAAVGNLAFCIRENEGERKDKVWDSV